MDHSWTPEKLIAFEQDIANEFNSGKIRAPIHLDGGNEEQLIGVFKEYRPGDWVCGSWRMHYKCLLASVPPEKLKSAILAGRSITLCFPEHKVISSAIVGGILPIALGLAWSIKRSGGSEKVFCFLGDMTALGGMFTECERYARCWKLPIRWVVENNSKSVCTETEKVWNCDPWREGGFEGYDYVLPYPHSGAGKRVEF